MRTCYVVMLLLSFATWLALAGGATADQEPLQVASLNPIVSDLARQVGGNRVKVIDLMPVGSNPHKFYPSPDDLKQASRAALILAAGKGLETYLKEFHESIGPDIPLLEVGNAVPSLKVEVGEVFVCCPAHAHDAVDPHWWHSVKNTKRAARSVAGKLGEIDPDHADAYMKRYNTYAATLDDLYKWARKQIKSIPRQDRELTTSHAAFGYLCREFGLRSITLQGLTTEDNAEPGYLKDVIETLRKNKVKAVFPEDNANPKVIASMVRETGVKVGGALWAGTPPVGNPTYEAMIRSNITTIVHALSDQE